VPAVWCRPCLLRNVSTAVVAWAPCNTGIDHKVSLVAADFAGDGIPDVVAANSPLNPNVGSTQLMLEQGLGNGTFKYWTTKPLRRG
jgi:hypothetical protein